MTEPGAEYGDSPQIAGQNGHHPLLAWPCSGPSVDEGLTAECLIEEEASEEPGRNKQWPRRGRRRWCPWFGCAAALLISLEANQRRSLTLGPHPSTAGLRPSQHRCLRAAGLGGLAALLLGLAVVTYHEARRRQLRPPPTRLWVPTARFQRIAWGTCRELGWLPIASRAVCAAAARELSLRGAHPVLLTSADNRPEGCYYLENQRDNTFSLWFSTNESNSGLGAFDDGEGMTREPICQAQTTTLQPVSTSTTTTTTTHAMEGLLIDAMDDAVGFRKVSKGACADIGWLPIYSWSTCEAAAKFLGLRNTHVEITRLENRPMGCYYYKNYWDHTVSLWLNVAKRIGVTEAQVFKGGTRQPICISRAAATKRPPGFAASDFREISNSSCKGLDGTPVKTRRECGIAARIIGLADVRVKITQAPGRPEGCYIYRSPLKTPATLWLGTGSPSSNVAVGASRTGGSRLPICKFPVDVQTLASKAAATTSSTRPATTTSRSTLPPTTTPAHAGAQPAQDKVTTSASGAVSTSAARAAQNTSRPLADPPAATTTTTSAARQHLQTTKTTAATASVATAAVKAKGALRTVPEVAVTSGDVANATEEVFVAAGTEADSPTTAAVGPTDKAAS